MAGKASWSFVDYDGEVSTMQVHAADLTAANFDAQETLRDALETAVENLTLGNVFKTEKGNATLYSKAQPESEHAQRETKWLVMYEDDTTYKQHNYEVPTADLEQLPADGKELDLTAGVGLAFVTAFEAYALSPAGNTCTVQRIIHVGRNT
jgi:hypothetical protein